jgi:outer membrane immunogenic protein
MRKIMIATAFSLGVFAATSPALAQDVASSASIEPYFGVMGSIHSFDSETSKSGIPAVGYDGRLVEGVAGLNIALGNRFFIGAEGNVAKGVDGDINWEYGAAGRFGVRMNDNGKIYGKVGYRWVNFDKQVLAGGSDYHDMTYGAGFELSPGGAASKLRIRGEVETFGNFNSIRPSIGIVLGF